MDFQPTRNHHHRLSQILFIDSLNTLQQTRTFHQTVKGSGSNALDLLFEKELGENRDFLWLFLFYAIIF